MIEHISAVTFAVRHMGQSIDFYTALGFEIFRGDTEASFSTLVAGRAIVNLTVDPEYTPHWWGRTIFRVDDVDTLYDACTAQGLNPEPPRDAWWGERFFHLTDPDGHELSFAALRE